MMKISLCSIKFRDDPIEGVVERTAQLGYDGIEIVVDHIENYLKRKGELESLRDFVHSKGLEIPIIAPAFNFTGTVEELKANIEKAYRCIGYAETLGAPLIRAFVSNTGSEEATEAHWNQCVSALGEIAAAAYGKGIAFAIETHPNQLMDTVPTTLKLVQRVNSPGLRVLLDIWHLFNEGKADPVEALHTLYPYIVHIHAKNMIRHPEGDKVVYFEEGDMDYPPFIEALKKTDYDRFVSVEWFGENSWGAAEHELSYLRKFLQGGRVMSNKMDARFKHLSDEEFSEAVDLSLPGLEPVRMAVEQGNYDEAGAAFVQHLRQRSALKNKSILLTYDEYQTDHNSDDLCRHIFNIYCERFDLGQDIDWGKNPEGATDSCWAEILNVHNWINTLALAYERTKNEKYAAACAELLADWIAKNPTPLAADSFPPVWPAWSGVVARLGSWLDCFSFFLHSPSFSDRLWLDISKSMLTQMRYIRKRTTWAQSWILSMGCQSLIGLLLPELKESKGWVEEGLQRLEELYKEWFYPDGASTFTAMDYHMAFYGWFDGIARLMLTSDMTPPAWLKKAVEKMLRFIAYTAKPNGEVPMVSDTWRINVANLLRDDASILNLPDVLYIATAGKEGIAPPGTSCEFPHVGYYIMRSGWDKDAQYLLFDVGSFGHGGHGHQDKLNIIVHAYGRTLITDPGVGSYRDMALGQNSFRRYSTTTRSHNTITVEWKDQLELNGRIEELPGNKWVSTADYDFAASVYTEGYGDYHWEELHPRDTFEPIRIVHRRKLFFVKGEYWILSDLLEGEGTHEYESTFQFSPGPASFDSKTKAAWTTDPNSANIMLAPVPDEKLAIRIAEGERDPLLGWVSYNYGDAHPAPMAVYTLERVAPCAIDMVILPFRKGEERPSVSVKRLPVTEGERELLPTEATCLEISINGKVDYYLISHLPPSLKRFGPFEFDGEVAHIREGKVSKVGGTIV